MNNHSIFIGIDGGATKSIVRIEDDKKKFLGKETFGPTSLRFETKENWQKILEACQHILSMHHLSFDQEGFHFHAGIGIAGCELEDAYQSFLAFPQPFNSLSVISDAHIACLGAHSGMDGVVIVIGTGVVGYAISNHQCLKIGGWGFPHDDEGGGAWIGLKAINLLFQSLDNRIASGLLVNTIFNYFKNDKKKLIHFANHANANQFATLAPLVIEMAKQGDVNALSLLSKAANKIEKLIAVYLKEYPHLSIALIGGLASSIQPYLQHSIQSRLVKPVFSADEGAIIFLKQRLKQNKE